MTTNDRIARLEKAIAAVAAAPCMKPARRSSPELVELVRAAYPHLPAAWAAGVQDDPGLIADDDLVSELSPTDEPGEGT